MTRRVQGLLVTFSISASTLSLLLLVLPRASVPVSSSSFLAVLARVVLSNRPPGSGAAPGAASGSPGVVDGAASIERGQPAEPVLVDHCPA
jgi:hypothetical protein